MNKGQTISYLREALRLETDCITQRKTMNWMKNRINSLAIPNRIVKEEVRYHDPVEGDDTKNALIGAWLGVFIFMILFGSLKGAGIVAIIMLIVLLIVTILVLRNRSKKIEEAETNYDHKLKIADENYQKARCAENARIEKEKKQKTSLSTDLAILKQQNDETVAALNQLYDLDIVYPKYRNISAISMFIQYLESGMCSEFGGPNGCYMIYEQELRTGAIISSIDEMSKAVVNSIGEMSDNISRSQYELYNAISESNSQIKRLCTTTDDIKRHQAVLEAQNEQQLNTTRALGEYVVYRDLLR